MRNMKQKTRVACFQAYSTAVGGSEPANRAKAKQILKLKLKSELHSAKNVLKQMEINKIFRQATGEQAAD